MPMKRYCKEIGRIKGVCIDIGGPLRVSDIEMNTYMKAEFNANGLTTYPFTPGQTWQLYGIFASEGYEGWAETLLSIARSGENVVDIFQADGVPEALRNLRVQYIVPSDKPLIAEMAKAAEAAYNAAPSKRVQPDAAEALKRLRGHDIPMSIVTAAFTEPSVKWAEELFPGYFSAATIIGKDTPVPEGQDPKSGKLVLAATRMNVPVGEMLYVADTNGDIDNSRKAGNQVGMVLDGMGFPALWKNCLPDYEFDNLKDAAHFVIAVQSLFK